MGGVAIRVEAVSKNFRLPQEKSGTVKSVFTNVFKRRNRTIKTQHALRDVSFEIKKGEFFGIVGRNGSGKSTLLKMLAGIYQPTKGRIHVEGKLVPFIELGVGFNPELTGRQNVYLNGALLGFSEKEINEQYEDIVEFAELKPFMDQKLKNYSSGMQVRLAFSMAVRAKADVLLIDEVLAVGDADFQRKCFDYFNQLKGGDTTVIFVSHNMDAVREYCDRAMLVDKSRIVDLGSTDVIAEEYLQLFAQESNVQKADGTSKADRWGNQCIQIKDIAIEVTQKSITVTQLVQSNIETPRPIIGIRVRDVTGREITGTNTKIENTKMPDMMKGQKFKLTFTFPNILRDGKYTIDPAILYADEATVADWWNNAISFTVQKKRHLPYVIDPGFTVNVEEQ